MIDSFLLLTKDFEKHARLVWVAVPVWRCINCNRGHRSRHWVEEESESINSLELDHERDCPGRRVHALPQAAADVVSYELYKARQLATGSFFDEGYGGNDLLVPCQRSSLGLVILYGTAGGKRAQESLDVVFPDDTVISRAQQRHSYWSGNEAE